jgi:hypothetical protein
LGAGHVSKINTIAYMAPALGGLILATRGKLILGGAVFALFFALNVSANHLQMTYYLAMMLGLVALAEGIRLIVEKKIKYMLQAVAVLIVALVIAILPSMSNLLTTYEYSKFTTRGGSELTIQPDGKPIDVSEKSGLETGYILDYNFAKGEAWSMVIPNIKGGKEGAIGNDKELMTSVPKEYREDISNYNKYWGAQSSTGGAFYFGAAIMFLFALGLIFMKDSLKWPFIVLTLVAIGLCSADPGGMNGFFISKFPMYSKFRDSKMILTIIQVIAPAVAILFLDKVIKGEGLIANRKAWLIGTGGVILVVIILYIFPSITGDFISPADHKMIADEIEKAEKIYASNPAMLEQATNQIRVYEDTVFPELVNARTKIYKQDTGRSLLIILLVASFLVMSYFKKLPSLLFIAILCLIVATDQILVCKRYLNFEQTKGQYYNFVKANDQIAPNTPSVADKAILDAEKISVQDFDGKKNALLAQMKGSHLYKEARSKDMVDQIAQFGALGLNTDYRVVRLGNPFNDAYTSYYHKSIGGYHGAKLSRYQDLISFHLAQELKFIQDTLKSLGDIVQLENTPALNMLNTKYLIYNPEAEPIPNPYACGNAWFVKEVKTVKSADEEITSIKGFNPKTTAIVSNEFANLVRSPAGVDTTASVTLDLYATKKLSYTTKSSVEGPVIFSEIYYPAGWTCTIDGQPAEPFRANYVLRGLMVPAGEHKVEWTFAPASFEKGSTYSLIGSVLLLLVVIGSFAFELRKVNG